jgi:predicted aldo/keto reductase-like oxidoreductase
MAWWHRGGGGDDEGALSRRDFFRRFGGAAVEKVLPGLEDPTRRPPPSPMLPQRLLGRTGATVPILGLGTARLTKARDEGAAAELVNEAIDLGVTYIDTGSEAGGYGRSQAVIGEVMRLRRRQVFLATKIFEPDAAAGRAMLERALRELETDQVDLLYVHALGHDHMDPAVTLGPNGVLQMLEEARREGLCRFVGATCHNRPDRLLQLLGDHPLDVIMTAVNFADVHNYGFEHRVWPLARQQGCGLVAMKVFGGPAPGGDNPAYMPREHQDLAFRYALSLEGCATAVVGMLDRRELHENVRRARTFQPLTKEEWEIVARVGPELAAEWGPHLGEV